MEREKNKSEGKNKRKRNLLLKNSIKQKLKGFDKKHYHIRRQAAASFIINIPGRGEFNKLEL